MKKVSLLLLAASLSIISSAAQSSSATATKLTTVADSIISETISTDSLVVTTPELDESEPTVRPEVYAENGFWMVKYDDKSYRLADITLDERLPGLSGLESLDDLTSDQQYLQFMEENAWVAIAIMLVVFGVPTIAFIAFIIVICSFALKRNRARNELINNAIEHDYQLPDAFFNGGKSMSANGQPLRDSRTFYQAVTFMAIGIAFIVFSISVEAPFFSLVGLIPFLIGLGKMIGYFCVPNNPRNFYPPQPLAGDPRQNCQFYQPGMNYPYMNQQVTPQPMDPNPGAPQPMDQNTGMNPDSEMTPPPYNPR